MGWEGEGNGRMDRMTREERESEWVDLAFSVLLCSLLLLTSLWSCRIHWFRNSEMWSPISSLWCVVFKRDFPSSLSRREGSVLHHRGSHQKGKGLSFVLPFPLNNEMNWSSSTSIMSHQNTEQEEAHLAIMKQECADTDFVVPKGFTWPTFPWIPPEPSERQKDFMILYLDARIQEQLIADFEWGISGELSERGPFLYHHLSSSLTLFSSTLSLLLYRIVRRKA